MSRSKPKDSLTDFNNDTVLAEAFKQLRINIDYSCAGDHSKVITITSSKNGEGKSTVAANLAIAYAQSSKKVLLIDADLKKPSLHLFFSNSNNLGLTSVLAGQVEIKNAGVETSVKGLYLLPSGTVPAGSVEMLSSKRLSSVMEKLKELYDMVIIDAPSLLATSDAQVLAAASDGVMLVIQSGKVKREAVAKAQEHLALVKARVLGAVLNHLEPKRIVSYLK